MSNGRDASVAERLNEKLHRLCLLLFIVYLVLSSFCPVMNNVDLGWHVAQGRWMVQHAALYRHDVLNYPNLGHPVINEYPIFQVVLYLAWSLGWWGPSVLNALVYVLLLAVLIRAGRLLDLQTSAFLATALGLLLLYLQINSLLRPHLATYLGIVILATFLLRHRETTTWKVFWPMALLQVAWTNSHSGFVIGPAMAALFGAEMIVRHAIRDRAIPWPTLKTWLGAFLLILLACFVNPYGAGRFYPAFIQDHLESIRAYVGEMEPLGGTAEMLCEGLTLFAAFIVAGAVLRGRGAISYSFLLLAILFHSEAESIQKAWPVFGLFVPLLILSSGAFASDSGPARKTGMLAPYLILNFLITSILAMAVLTRLDGTSGSSLKVQWREFTRSHTELSVDATVWLKAHGPVILSPLMRGRLFHRCEDGGWLQQEGFYYGEVFSDTGFGKYDEAFIHEVGLVNERPALVPRYLRAYQPDYVICSTFCYQWPFYLRQSGWRPIFYSPNSSVWTRPETRTDLPTVRDEEIMAAFDRELATFGRPLDTRFYGRNLIALNSLGLEDFAFAKLKALPEDIQHAAWYWEAARFLCFAEPAFSPAHRDELRREAEALPDNGVTAEFRAYCKNGSGDTDGALRILEGIPKNQLGNYAAELLLKIYLDRKRPEALDLARRADCFDLRNGRHWQYLAQAEDEAGHPDAAARAWKKAVFYYPDDAALMRAAAGFAEKFHDAELAAAIQDSARVYGESNR